MSSLGVFARGAILVCLAGACVPTRAQDLCPGNIVKFIVPFPASGASADVVSRVVAGQLAQLWGKSVILEHRPGAGGIAANQIVAASPPDGCTIALVTAAIAINPSLNRKLPYDTLKDLAMVTQLVDIPVGVFVHPSVPAGNLRELLAHAAKQAQGLSYGSPGVGTGSHLAGALLASMTGAKLVHVPYKGAAAAEFDLLAGRIPLMFAAVSTEVAAVKAGTIRLLAVTGGKRFPGFPDVPTVGETLPGFAVASYFGVVAPGGTPTATVARISKDIATALASPEAKGRLDALQLVPVGSSPEAFGQLVRQDMQAVGRLVEAAGIMAE